MISAAGAISLVITRPSNVAAGDFLLAHVTFERGNEITVADIEIDGPNDWTQVRRDNFGADIGQAIFRKVAGSAEPASYTWEFRKGAALEPVRASGGVVRYTGVSTGTPVFGNTGTTGDTSPLKAPSILNAPAGSMVVAFFGIKKKTTLGSPTSSPVGETMTNQYIQQHSNDSGPTIRADMQQWTTTGATLERRSTPTTVDKWVGQQVVLHAAPRPGGWFGEHQQRAERCGRRWQLHACLHEGR